MSIITEETNVAEITCKVCKQYDPETKNNLCETCEPPTITEEKKAELLQSRFIENIYVKVMKKEMNCLVLGVKKIYDIDVGVEINFRSSRLITLNIESTKVYTADNDGNIHYRNLYFEYLFNANGNQQVCDLPHQFVELFKKVETILGSITFNKVKGEFIKGEPEVLFCQAFPNIFKSKNIESTSQECCTCYDQTQTRTPCNHPICIPCWAKINATRVVPNTCGEADCDDDQCECQTKTKLCPICRQDLVNGWD
jgi:hypothetical protein